MCSTLLSVKGLSPLLSFIRNGHRIRGKAPGVAKTLSQRLAEENFEEPELNKKHDIGFPLLKPSRSAELRNRLEHLKKQREDLSLEKLARSHELKIDLSAVKDDWIKSGGPFQVRKIAEHYQIFNHLFGNHAFFTPRVNLDIKFKISDDVFCPVYHGNRIRPAHACNAPDVVFDHTFSMKGDKESNKNSLWTLVLANPDGNTKAEGSELVHWMVGNIPDGKSVLKGDIIVPYMQPVSPKGTGFHRYVFVLYKQENKIDLEQFKVSDPNKLDQRSFNSFEFYKNLQDEITPAGLSFFQSKWDDSVTSFYHNVLNTKEPIYDYDYPKIVLKKQKQFPHRQPFNLYMDRYADPKEVNKRFLEEKLAKTHPFDGPEKKVPFPNAEFMSDEPSWLKSVMRKKRLERGRIRDFNRQSS